MYLLYLVQARGVESLSWGRSDIHCVGKIKKNRKRWVRKKTVFRMSRKTCRNSIIKCTVKVLSPGALTLCHRAGLCRYKEETCVQQWICKSTTQQLTLKLVGMKMQCGKNFKLFLCLFQYVIDSLIECFMLSALWHGVLKILHKNEMDYTSWASYT